MQSVDPYMSQCVPNLLQLGLVGHITRVLLFCIVFVVDRALGIVCVCVRKAFVVQRALAVKFL